MSEAPSTMQDEAEGPSRRFDLAIVTQDGHVKIAKSCGVYEKGLGRVELVAALRKAGIDRNYGRGSAPVRACSEVETSPDDVAALKIAVADLQNAVRP